MMKRRDFLKCSIGVLVGVGGLSVTGLPLSSKSTPLPSAVDHIKNRIRDKVDQLHDETYYNQATLNFANNLTHAINQGKSTSHSDVLENECRHILRSTIDDMYPDVDTMVKDHMHRIIIESKDDVMRGATATMCIFDACPYVYLEGTMT